jgi:hypothetical protein
VRRDEFVVRRIMRIVREGGKFHVAFYDNVYQKSGAVTCSETCVSPHVRSLGAIVIETRTNSSSRTET